MSKDARNRDPRCSLGQVAALAPGEVIDLDRGIGEPFEPRAGGIPLAHVEPVAYGAGLAASMLRSGHRSGRAAIQETR